MTKAIRDEIAPLTGPLTPTGQRAGVTVANDAAALSAKSIEKRLLAFSEMDPKAGRVIAFEKLRAFRKELDDIVSGKGAYEGVDVSKLGGSPHAESLAAQEAAANAIRTELGKAAPDIAKLNKEYTFWRRVQKVMAETNKRRTGQAERLGEQILFGTGSTAGGIVGGTVGGLGLGGAAGAAILTGYTLKLFRKVTTSAGWHLASAQAKAKLAKALASGDNSAVNAVLTGMLAARPAGSLRRSVAPPPESEDGDGGVE